MRLVLIMIKDILSRKKIAKISVFEEIYRHLYNWIYFKRSSGMPISEMIQKNA